MPVFKISDLIDRLKEIQSDGFEYVELTLLEEDDNSPASLEFESFEPIGNAESCGVGYDGVDAVDIDSL